jgi:hypothetical protein
VTRIPQLEQELVAAAERLRRPRWLIRPAARAALAIAAVVGVLAVALVLATDDDGDRRSQPAGAPPPPSANQDRQEEALLTDRPKVARTANAWARLFAAGKIGNCKFMSQPACERITCQTISGPLEDCTPVSARFRRSFTGARVEDVEVRGYRAVARFSNGQVVELEGQLVEPVPESGPEFSRAWRISEFGPGAGRDLFE